MQKILIVIFVLIVILLLGSFIFEKTYNYPKQVKFGVTYSSRYAKYLNLDWQKTYLSILDDLKVRYLRIPAYWDLTEPKKDQYDFTETDYLVDEANKRDAKIILGVGVKQPRWPECYTPAWAKSLEQASKRQQILQYIQKTVQRYKDNPAVIAWQVENEPFLPFFGEECDLADADFLATEVNLVRALSNKTIIISDSGELGFWNAPMQLADVFGTTLYREVYNPVMGYFTYPTLPYFYNLHSQIIKKIFAPNNQKTIVIELQAEPWFASGDPAADLAKQIKQFPVSKMESYVNFAKKTGFDEILLWGVEWWYLMAANNHPEYLNYAKTLF